MSRKHSLEVIMEGFEGYNESRPHTEENLKPNDASVNDAFVVKPLEEAKDFYFNQNSLGLNSQGSLGMAKNQDSFNEQLVLFHSG